MRTKSKLCGLGEETDLLSALLARADKQAERRQAPAAKPPLATGAKRPQG